MGISFVILKFPTYLNAPSIAYNANGRGIPVPIMDTNWKKKQKKKLGTVGGCKVVKPFCDVANHTFCECTPFYAVLFVCTLLNTVHAT